MNNKHNFSYTEPPLCLLLFRSGPLKAFLWETVLKISSKLTKEHCSEIVISIKLLCIYMEITLWHRCSPVNLLHISEHLFIRTPLKDCFCLYISLLLLLHSFYASCELSHFSINLSLKAATRRSSIKKMYCIFNQKLLE